MKPFNEADPQKGVEIKPGEYAFHGDVVVYGENKLPSDFESMKKVEDDCLAYGELTGHLHKVIGKPDDFDLREDSEGIRYLKVVNPVMLKHQEHKPIEIAPGNYRIGIQREYDPFSKRVRRVID